MIPRHVPLHRKAWLRRKSKATVTREFQDKTTGEKRLILSEYDWRKMKRGMWRAGKKLFCGICGGFGATGIWKPITSSHGGWMELFATTRRRTSSRVIGGVIARRARGGNNGKHMLAMRRGFGRTSSPQSAMPARVKNNLQESPRSGVFWNPYNKVVQDHRDGTIYRELTDVLREGRGLPVPWKPEFGEKECREAPVY